MVTQLYQFLSLGGAEWDSYTEYATEIVDNDDANLVTNAQFDALKECETRNILACSEMSTNHLGGDDLVNLADKICDAIDSGYCIATWYGPGSEALIAGYRLDELTIVD